MKLKQRPFPHFLATDCTDLRGGVPIRWLLRFVVLFTAVFYYKGTKKRRDKGFITLCSFLPLFLRMNFLPDFLLNGSGEAKADLGATLGRAVEF